MLRSLRRINWKLYAALLVMGLCPTVYTTVRTHLLDQLPGEWAFSIAGQLSWVNLLYEVINEAIILPLYFFLGKVVADRREFSNRLRSGLAFSMAVYVAIACVIVIFARPMLKLMAASPDIIDASAQYIRIESIANIFGVTYSFSCVALVAVGRERQVYLLTGIKLALCLAADTFLVSSLPVSAQLGVNGIGVSNVIVNVCLTATVLVMLARQGYSVLAGGRPPSATPEGAAASIPPAPPKSGPPARRASFAWLRELAGVGGISGAESLVRNAAYMLMVSRMVNMVGEQGTYWVANNFIWGWLLLPVLQLGELIKRETSEDEGAIAGNTPGYLAATGAMCLLWIALIPLYRPFLQYILNAGDVEKVFRLILILLVPYMFFAFQNVFDMTFYGRGKTGCMLFESVVTNTVYYGAFFVLYLTGAWVPTLTGIAVMFGLGNVFDSVVSGAVYAWFLRKNRIRLSRSSAR